LYKILTEDSSYELSHFRGGLPGVFMHIGKWNYKKQPKSSYKVSAHLMSQSVKSQNKKATINRIIAYSISKASWLLRIAAASNRLTCIISATRSNDEINNDCSQSFNSLNCAMNYSCSKFRSRRMMFFVAAIGKTKFLHLSIVECSRFT